MRTSLLYMITLLPCLGEAAYGSHNHMGDILHRAYPRKPYIQPFGYTKRIETTWRRLLGPGYSTNRRDVWDEEYIRMLYPGYFMSPDEIGVFVDRFKRLTKSYSVPYGKGVRHSARVKYGGLWCGHEGSFGVADWSDERRTNDPESWKKDVCDTGTGGTARRKRNSVTIWHHACVQSSQTCKLVENATNVNGEYVELVQLTDLFQYFMEEDMELISSCTLCVGDQPEPFIHQAVVWVDRDAPDPIDRMDYDYIITKGCSKCLNV